MKIHPCLSEEQRNDKKREVKPLQHPVGVKALLPLYVPSLDETYLFTASGDIIRSWDTSDLDDKVEQRSEINGHWHDVTLLKAWFTSELHIVSASLDGTIRRWKVKGNGEFEITKRIADKQCLDLLTPKRPEEKIDSEENSAVHKQAPGELTEEEERELDELLNSDG